MFIPYFAMSIQPNYNPAAISGKAPAANNFVVIFGAHE